MARRGATRWAREADVRSPDGAVTIAAPRVSWALLLALVGVLAWLRIFGTWFSQDDFRWLLRAAVETPVPLTAPRVLSMSLYFRAFHALFGAQPAPYHAFSLALHVGTGLLLFRVLAQRLAPGVAAAAAAMFLTSPALFDALHWISGIADLMCVAGLALAVWLLVAGDGGRTRPWLALAAYALALASKEIAVGAAPALVVLQLRRGGRASVACAILSAALAVLFALPALHAWQTGVGEPYALRPAAALLNLPAFTAAATLGGAAFGQPSDLAWARLPWVRGAGWGILAAWMLALAVRRSPAAWLGFLWFIGLLAPVVMLERQVYLYYLACALPGYIASVAFLVAGGAAPLPRWMAALVAALVLAQVAAVEARSGARLELAPLPVDFVLRRAVIARNAIGDLIAAGGTLRPRMVMLGQQPVDVAWRGQSTTEATDYTRDPWWDENVRGALADGDAIRLMVPAVGEVIFKPWLEPEDTSASIAAYRIDGHLTVADYATFVGASRLATPATFDQRLSRAGDLIRRRLFHEALRELIAAHALVPDHPDVLINLGALQVHLGDSTAALATLGRATEVAPGDLDARYNLGLLQWRLGRRDLARATWGRLLSDAPESDLAKAVRQLLDGHAR